MDSKVIYFDTTLFIDHFRKKNKTETELYKLTKKFNEVYISIITVFEIYRGVKKHSQLVFWDNLLSKFKVIEFTKKENIEAIEIYKDLKKRTKLIGTPDLLIAATAIAHKLELATFNREHFGRVWGLRLYEFREN